MATRQIISKSINVASGAYIGKDGELWVDTVSNTMRVSDGATPGGVTLTGDNTSTWANITDINNAGGPSRIAIGFFAGSTSQSADAVAIGSQAGSNTQGISAVAIGRSAGLVTQGEYATAIGLLAGYTGQGNYSIAIGREAGKTNQAANSIVINATNAILENTVANTFVVKPVRGVAGATLPAGFKQVAYNPTTGEFIYYDM